MRTLCSYYLANHILGHKPVPGTLLHRLLTYNVSPVKLMFTYQKTLSPLESRNGIVDSLRYLLMHEHFLKPYSEENVLASLLVKAF